MSMGGGDRADPAASGERLPDGFEVQVDRRVRVLGSGEALLGGSPTRLLRLAPAARTMLTGGRLEVRDATSARLARTLLDATVAHPRPRPAGGPGYRDVTVVIPCRDNMFRLRRLLRSLRGMQVIVVDDGSIVPIDERDVAELNCSVQLVRNERSLGPAAARNTGLRLVTTDFVAFLDSDVVPVRGWLEALMGHFSDPSVALVAPRIVGLAVSNNVIARYEAVRSSLDLGRREAPVVPYGAVSYVPSAAVLARRSAINAINGFDETLRCGEDVDLCWRLVEAGSRLRYEPIAHVAHDHRLSPRQWFGRKVFYGFSAAPLSSRHPGKVAPLVISRWSLSAWILVAVGSSLGYVAAAALVAVAVGRVIRTLRRVETPAREVARVAVQAAASAGLQIASALCRHYLPFALVASVRSRRCRHVLAAAAILDGVVDWTKHSANAASAPRSIGLAEYVVLKRLDDLAYGIGLWSGVVRERKFGALRPEIRS